MRQKGLHGKSIPMARSAVKKTKKSKLAKQAEKFFSFHDSDLATPRESVPSYTTAPLIVQTFTTYSVCEDPIPDLRKQKQA